MFSRTLSTATIAKRLSSRKIISKPHNAILSQTALFFSTSSCKYDRSPRSPPPPHPSPPHARGSSTPPPPEQNPPNPRLTFHSLGASRKVKFFVIACLVVFGTIESLFWIKVLWARISSSPTDEKRGS